MPDPVNNFAELRVKSLVLAKLNAAGNVDRSSIGTAPKYQASDDPTGLTGQNPGGLVNYTGGEVYVVTSAGTPDKLAREGGSPDFGSTGISADLIAESTTASGVTVDGVLLKDGEVQPASDASAAGTGVTLTSEQLQVRTALLTLADVDIALTDEAGVVAYGGLKILDFPEGAVCILGAVADLDITKSSAGVNDDWDGDFALGTVTASNNASLTSTEANIIPSTATPQATAGATTANGQSTATECPAYLDGTGTAVDVYLNFLVDDADHDVTSTPCNLIANGTIKLTYAVLGDY